MTEYAERMERPRQRTVRIVCDAQSHAPRVRHVRRFSVVTFTDFEDGETHVTPLANKRGDDAEANVALDGDERIPDSERFGTSTIAPSERSWDARRRYALKCDLCGLNVTLRHETAEQRMTALVAANVSRVTLSALAATL